MNWQETVKKSNGAHFCWADLHVHTPIGTGFSLTNGSNIDSEKARMKVAKAYVDQAISRGICLLGITEHNDVSWIDYIRNAAIGTSVVVLPGFEITANTGGDGVHLVCLFDPDRKTKDLGGSLSLTLLPMNRCFPGKRNPASSKGEEHLIRIKEGTGLMIPLQLILIGSVLLS